MLRSLFRKDWACGVHILCKEQLNLQRNLSPWKLKNDAWVENSWKRGRRCNSEQKAQCLLFCFAHRGFSWRSQTNTWMMTWMFLTLNFRIVAAYFFLKMKCCLSPYEQRHTWIFLFRLCGFCSYWWILYSHDRVNKFFIKTTDRFALVFALSHACTNGKSSCLLWSSGRNVTGSLFRASS